MNKKEIGRAIEYFKDEKIWKGWKAAIRYHDLAIQALEMQLSKESIDREPCNYCKGIYQSTPASPRHRYIYCPMCKREL